MDSETSTESSANLEFSTQHKLLARSDSTRLGIQTYARGDIYVSVRTGLSQENGRWSRLIALVY